MKEERGNGVEVDSDRRPEFLARLAHRHPDSLEVAEARDEERLLARRRLRALRRGRAVAVDEDERLAFGGVEVEVQRLGPRADLVRRGVQRDEGNPFPDAEILADPRDEVLELPDAGRAAEEDRVVRRESVLHSGHLGPGFRSSARRRRLMHRAARCAVLPYIGRAVVLKTDISRATGREAVLRVNPSAYKRPAPWGGGGQPRRESA